MTRIRETVESLTMEHVLLAVFMGTAAYMFLEAGQFGDAARPFPRFTAGAVLVLGTLLLLREYLPVPLQRLVKDEMDVARGAEELAADEADAADALSEPEEAVGEATDETATVGNGALVTGMLCVAYLLVSYLVGMLWATPMFVVAYMQWTGENWRRTLALALFSFLVAYGFFEVLNLDIHRGLVHDLLVEHVVATVPVDLVMEATV